MNEFKITSKNWSLKNIANFIFNECSQNTLTGQWLITFDEIENRYNIKLTQEMIKEIETILYKIYGNAILDTIITNEGFDVNIGGLYYESDYEEYLTDEEDEYNV